MKSEYARTTESDAWRPLFSPLLTPSEVEGALPHLKISHQIVISGQGAVFKAKRATGEAVALKIYFPSQDIERAHREAIHLKNLNCPSLVVLENFGQTRIRNQSCFFTETKFEDGLDLHQRIAQHGKLSVNDTIRLIDDVAAALETLWNSHKIIHCDLKPQNVLVGQSRFIVIDLGLAKYIELPGITPSGNWKMGTDGYMPPEQTRGRQFVTPRSDIFSLGIIGYIGLTGIHPFNGQQQLINLSSFRPTDPKSLVASDVPDTLRSLLARMLAFDSLRRPGSAAEVRKTLQSI